MNRGQWARLEACARTTGPVRGAKWVISGPMIYTERDVAFVTVDTLGETIARTFAGSGPAVVVLPAVLRMFAIT